MFGVANTRRLGNREIVHLDQLYAGDVVELALGAVGCQLTVASTLEKGALPVMVSTQNPEASDDAERWTAVGDRAYRLTGCSKLHMMGDMAISGMQVSGRLLRGMHPRFMDADDPVLRLFEGKVITSMRVPELRWLQTEPA